MTHFRQPKKDRQSPRSIDGFIPRTPQQPQKRTVRRQFQTAYRPPVDREGTDAGSNNAFDRPRVDPFADIEQTTLVNDVSSHVENEQKKRRFSLRRKNKKEKLNKNSKFKKASKVFAIFSAATLIGVASLFGYGFLKARNIFKGDGDGAAALQENVDPARLNGEGDGRVNVLLIGKGGPGETAPDLTDSLLLASIDPVQNEASLVSVPRDMYVLSESGSPTKINAIYANAKQSRLANGSDTDADREAAENIGLDAIKDSISEVLGIPVHYYVMVDFQAFEDAINTVGGLTIDVEEPLYDQTVAHLFNGNPLVADEGLQTMDGFRALIYARSRKGSARGDFDRTERQREIIVALQKEILSADTYSNPFKVVELLNTFGDRVRTDLNGLDEIKRLYEIGQKIGPDKIGSVGLADPPNVLVTTDFINGQSVVVPTAGLYQYDDIHSYIRNNLRDAFLKSEDAKVIILNGTTIAGLAGATSDELKSYGYNVVSVDNAPTQDYVQNQLIELNPGQNKYTKSYIERRLGLTSTTVAPAGIPDNTQADFVIILGTDEATKTTN